MSRLAIQFGAGNAALAILFGAFAAHGLRNSLTPKMLEVFQTAVDYHLYHALGMLVIGLLLTYKSSSKLLITALILMIIGVILFCGSLYLLSVTETNWLGMITPFGGIAFIASWILVLLAFLVQEK